MLAICNCELLWLEMTELRSKYRWFCGPSLIGRGPPIRAQYLRDAPLFGKQSSSLELCEKTAVFCHNQAEDRSAE